MRVRVLYFGWLRANVTRTAGESVDLAAKATVADLVDQLCRDHPGLREKLPHLKVAVNDEFVDPRRSLTDNDEVAMIPPVAGGAESYCHITDQPLSVDEVVGTVTAPGQGAIVTFTGVVRDNDDGVDIAHMEYEAHLSMARRNLPDIVRRCEQGAPGVRVGVAHRYGVLRPGEIVVVIAASAPRRLEAFNAARQCIELIKAELPIWKKGVGVDGDSWWVEAPEGMPSGEATWS